VRYAVALAVAALFGLSAQPASAATVSATVSHGFDPGVPAKGVPPVMTTSSSLRIDAPAGETNTVTARLVGIDVVEVQDTSTPPAAGAGCTRPSESVVRCAVEGPLVVNAALGDGNDSWESGAVDARVNGGAGDDRLHGAGRLTGGSGDDVLTGIALPTGPPTVTVLDGGTGADRMSEGVVSYAGRTQPVTVDLADPGTDGAAGEGDVIEQAAGVTGGNGNDVLLGTDGPDQLNGGRGVDRLEGRGGDDDLAGAGQLDAGDGDDTINGDGTLLGGDGNDTLRGSAGGAIADGGPGDDSVAESASASPDHQGLGTGPIVLIGGPGDDAVGAGGSGAVPALLDGGEGNDAVWGGNIADRGDAGPGDDTIRPFAGDTIGRLACGAGSDVIEPSGVGNLARPECERVRPFFGAEGGKNLFPRRPKTTRRVARFRFAQTCGGLADIGAARKCLVRVELRTTTGRLIGLSSVRLHGGGKATVRVPLGRSLAHGKVAVRLHILGADVHGRQEALNGGWVAR
jgi:Ca2+-binding RTX toxin-like protein